MTDHERDTENEILEAHRQIREATAAIEQLELAVRSNLHVLKDTLLNMSAALLAIARKVDDERRQRLKG